MSANENELDPDHPFEAVLLEMAKLSRRKRADYARDGSPFSNFYETAAIMQRSIPGFTALDSIDFNVAQKDVRLAALAANGRLDRAENESVRDTLIDKAVYSAIKVAVYDEGFNAFGAEKVSEA